MPTKCFWGISIISYLFVAIFVSLDKINKEFWPFQSAVCAKNAMQGRNYSITWYPACQVMTLNQWQEADMSKVKALRTVLWHQQRAENQEQVLWSSPVFWIAYMPNSYTSDAQLTPSPRLFHLSWNLALPPALLALLFCCEGICRGEKRSPLTYPTPWALAIQHWTIVLLSKTGEATSK